MLSVAAPEPSELDTTTSLSGMSVFSKTVISLPYWPPTVAAQNGSVELICAAIACAIPALLRPSSWTP